MSSRDLVEAIEFQSTLPARGATGLPRRLPGLRQQISIHAPREGSDGTASHIFRPSWSFQSTLPARGATASSALSIFRTTRFQSTLPARGATGGPLRRGRLDYPDFNPRSPRGERREFGTAKGLEKEISIHAPREGSDGNERLLLVREAWISIHAPREGSDGRHETTQEGG